MSADQEDELRAIWQSHLTTARPFSAEQLQARALLLESRARRSIRVNQICSGLVALIIAVSLFTQKGGLFFVVGEVMLLVVAVYIAWGNELFFCTAAHSDGCEHRNLRGSPQAAARTSAGSESVDPLWSAS
ncbi:MAG: hypothetical protein WDM77_03555 [Steroidobacteraceae bacterium]